MPYRMDDIDPSVTAVLVIDMENDFVAEGAALRSAQAAAMVPRLSALLKSCRERGMRVIYTSHVHRSDGCDMGRFADLYPPIALGMSLVDGTPGVDIFPDLAPAANEHVVKKHRYSAFFATDMDIILRGWGITNVVIVGTTTENCCHASARDAMFLGYKVAFISDCTGTFDYPDLGYGAMSAEEVHLATLRILAFSTAHVMTGEELLVKSGTKGHTAAEDSRAAA